MNRFGTIVFISLATSIGALAQTTYTPLRFQGLDKLRAWADSVTVLKQFRVHFAANDAIIPVDVRKTLTANIANALRGIQSEIVTVSAGGTSTGTLSAVRGIITHAGSTGGEVSAIIADATKNAGAGGGSLYALQAIATNNLATGADLVQGLNVGAINVAGATGSTRAISASASGSGSNQVIGFYGQASGGSTNWAGYFDAGNTLVQNTLYGSESSAGNLELASTSHATKGKIIFGTSAYDEANNRVGLGTSNPADKLDVVGNDATLLRPRFSVASATQSHRTLLDFYRSRGTAASPTIIGSADDLGSFRGIGYDGNSFVEGIGIDFLADGTVTQDVALPTKMIFYTTPSGSQTIAKHMTLDNAGDLIVSSDNTTNTLGSGNIAVAGSNSGITFLKRGTTNLTSTTNGDRWTFYSDASGANLFTGSTSVLTIAPAGIVTKISNIASLEGLGVQPTVDRVGLTGQTASIVSESATNTATAGEYEVHYYLSCTATGTGNVTATIKFDNATKTITSAVLTLSSVNNFVQGTVNVRHEATAGSSIEYSTVYTTTGTYNLYIWTIRAN